MNAPSIDVRNLTLRRGKRTVLAGVDLHIEGGVIVCLLGPSGSGKSSLLRCINRLTEPPPGAVFVDGADVAKQDVLALRQRVGMVFQTPALFPGTTADNIRYGPALQGRRLSEPELHALLAQADLALAYAERPASELSGGEQQRVALARTLATGPRALLLDEPTSALDPTATRNIEQTLLKLRREMGMTLLWVTHDIEQAERVADRLILLNGGKVAADGPPAQTLDAIRRHWQPKPSDHA